MKQQTAVQWLLEQYADGNYGIEVGEQALKMEKEQIVNAYNEKPFILSKEVSEDGAKVLFKGGEQYYSETYENPAK